MEAPKAFDLIERYKHLLFPNKKYSTERVENELMSAEDDFEIYIKPDLFKKPKTALLIEVFLGIWGIGMFYVGKKGRGILRLVMILLPSFLGMPIAIFSGMGSNSGSSSSMQGIMYAVLAVYVLIFVISLLIDIAQVGRFCREKNCESLIRLAHAHPKTEGSANRSVNAQDLLNDISIGNIDDPANGGGSSETTAKPTVSQADLDALLKDFKQ